jgi:putative spermidine/putrescine transport system substrate-binding protein
VDVLDDATLDITDMLTRRFVVQTGLAALAAPSIVRAQTPAGSVTLMAYGGIFQDNYTRAVIEPFRRAVPDVQIKYSPGGNSAPIVGSVRAQKPDPRVDVAIMNVTTSTIGNAEGLFDRITPAEAPSLDELYPEARAVGGEFGPAVTYDHFVLVYDTQNVKPPLATLADLWRPDLKRMLAVSAPPDIQGRAIPTNPPAPKPPPRSSANYDPSPRGSPSTSDY